MKQPAAKWSQDHRRVFVSVQIKGASSGPEPRFDLNADGTIQLQVGDQTFQVALSGGIEPDHSDTQLVCKPNSVELTIRKADWGYWPGLLQGGKKDRTITVDWDRWIDEDDCVDDEQNGSDEQHTHGHSAYEATAIANEEMSPIDGENADRFTQLNPNEKMLLLAHLWNACNEEQRGQVLTTLKGILDGDDSPAMNSDDLKGSGILGERTLDQFPPDVHLPHVEAWLGVFKGCVLEEQVGYFAKLWDWCNEEERKLVMGGLSR
eukprot:TRINITY_DN10900_c0_g1_i3.p1 TRINITY_DN10900_c0_g1~~TRINITY_DN10900_c0_g1_i3.p1  ORF type:complete len:263 (-),score=58.06 TRINITY_DN10900_c0_g1_i3:155-943(-)